MTAFVIGSIWGDNAPASYDTLLVVHLLAVITAFGPMFAFSLLGRVAKRNNGEVAAELATVVPAITSRISLPALIVAMLAGIGLVADSDGGYDFSQPWISAAFAIVIFVALVMWFMLGPARSRMLESTDGPDAESRDKRLHSITAMGTGFVHLALVALIVLMVWKPGL